MNTKRLVTLLTATIMLSTGVANASVVRYPVKAATQSTTINIKRRSVVATVNTDKPQLVAFDPSTQKMVKEIDSSYVKGQTVPVYFSTSATATVNGSNQSINLYYLENRTVDGKDCMIFIPSTAVTTASAVPSYEEYQKNAENDKNTVQNAYQEAYANRKWKSFSITPKSKKGAKVYYAYRKSAKSKKIVFKASKLKIKYGKKYKAKNTYKNGKTLYVYIGKKRYIKSANVKPVDIKYEPLNLPDNVKDLIANN